MSAIEMQTHLQQLEAERALAMIEGLGAAVTEIAVLRAELSEPLSG